MLDIQESSELVAKKCQPCEGGVPAYSMDEARMQVMRLTGWRLVENACRIRKDWKFKNFKEGMRFLEQVAELAEAEQHHPDMHLEGYRNVWIELWTHAIGGLSENDFILAAKIDELPAAISAKH